MTIRVRSSISRILLVQATKLGNFHTRLNNFPVFRNYCIALYGRRGNKRSNLNELKFDVKFCEIKAEDFQATFLIVLV